MSACPVCNRDLSPCAQCQAMRAAAEDLRNTNVALRKELDQATALLEKALGRIAMDNHDCDRDEAIRLANEPLRIGD